jgi:glycosyltransferase involved in cell wall biosynthesis
MTEAGPNYRISAVMPAFNEEDNLELCVRRLNEALRDRTGEYEMIVVNDGSADRTAQVLARLSERVTLRRLVQQAQAAGVPVEQAKGLIQLDDVSLRAAPDGRTWLIQSGPAGMAIVPPQTSWQSLPAGVDTAIFTSGGPAEWQGPGKGVSVIQVAANSRAGLPVRAVLQALGGAAIDRTDRLGTVELVAAGSRFIAAQ